MTVTPFSGRYAGATARLIARTLQVSCARDYPPQVIDNLRTAYAARGLRAMARSRDILLAFEDDRLVGTGALEGSTLQGLFVDPDAQGRGIGRALMAQLSSMARERGLPELRLGSSLTAVGFYERLGFRREGAGGDGTYGALVRMSRPARAAALRSRD